jgi:adenylate cyclase
MAGLSEAAANALSTAKRLQPALSIDWAEKYFHIVKASDREIYIQGLRAAGLK